MKFIQLVFWMVLFTTILSCTKEENLSTFSIKIDNTSTSTVKLIYKNSNGEEIDMIVVNSMDSYDCNYVSENFQSLRLCRNQEFFTNLSEVVFLFENNKGYSCQIMDNGFCFTDDRNNVVGSSGAGFELVDNVYIFKITQQDFDNAFDLP
ncbi:hypothetical protein [Nonlabens ulvanivorans]|nr:hypothetical protein [Nonlabens ulvanivorans]PRX14426.1 hypothetical protein LY02_01456 [Nonlabens ulvanivorans]